MLIKKYIKITIKDNEATPDDNLFFYKNDKSTCGEIRRMLWEKIKSFLSVPEIWVVRLLRG